MGASQLTRAHQTHQSGASECDDLFFPHPGSNPLQAVAIVARKFSVPTLSDSPLGFNTGGAYALPLGELPLLEN